MWPLLAMMPGNIRRRDQASRRKCSCLRPRWRFELQFMTPSWQAASLYFDYVKKYLVSILSASLHPDSKVYTQTYTPFSGASNLQPLQGSGSGKSRFEERWTVWCVESEASEVSEEQHGGVGGARRSRRWFEGGGDIGWSYFPRTPCERHRYAWSSSTAAARRLRHDSA